MIAITNKQQRLAQIAADITKNNICPDLAQTATQLVMGSGSLDPKVVFIGEAPGKNEDESGKPFVGASGRVLDELLESAGLSRADAYITNIVKYRPPNNRDPKAKEVQAFLPYLQRQLEVLSPKVVVTLGKHSLNALAPEAVLSEVVGKPHEIRRVTILPMYHPAAGIYNRKLLPVMKQHMQVLADLINTK